MSRLAPVDPRSSRQLARSETLTTTPFRHFNVRFPDAGTFYRPACWEDKGFVARTNGTGMVPTKPRVAARIHWDPWLTVSAHTRASLEI